MHTRALLGVFAAGLALGYAGALLPNAADESADDATVSQADESNLAPPSDLPAEATPTLPTDAGSDDVVVPALPETLGDAADEEGDGEATETGLHGRKVGPKLSPRQAASIR